MEHDGRSDDGFDIECFEIWKNNHEKLTEIEEYLISGSDRHIGHGGDGMTDDIDSHHEQDREERGNERREEEDDGEEEQEFEIDEPDRYEK